MSGVDLPLDERLYTALFDALSHDEADAQAALDAALPFVAAALTEAAKNAEWEFRSLSVWCGKKGLSETRLHPVGDWLRTRAARIAPTAAPSPDREPEPTPSEESR